MRGRAMRWLAAPLLLMLAVAVRAEPLPGDSIYQLPIPLVSQTAQDTTLDASRGHPVLISMFYASCGYVCPLLVRSTQRLVDGLDERARRELRVVLVSFDPDNDTPQALAEVARRHKVDAARWTLARAGASDVRKLAAALGIQYRRLPDGNFNHATVISLLDGDGRIVARTSNPANPDEAFIAALQKVTAAP